MSFGRSYAAIGLVLLVSAACAGDSPPLGEAARAPSPIPASRELGPSVVNREEVLDLPAEVTCETCRLELGGEFVLRGAEADGGTPGALGSVVRTADGRFAGVFWEVPAQIYVYDAEGSFESIIGAEGSGPGEFRMIGNGLFADGTDLVAFDSSLGRMTRIDARTGDPEMASWAAGNVMNAAFIAGQHVVLSARAHGSEEPGYPLHVFTSDGEWMRSFGREQQQEAQGDLWELVRLLAASSDGTFWSVPREELLLEHWTLEGERLRAFSAARERFEPFSSGLRGSQVSSLEIGDDGLLRLVYRTPVQDWENAVEPIPEAEVNPSGGPRVRLIPGRRAHDYYLEVIDPAAGVVLARSLLPGIGFYELVDANTLMRGWDDPDTGISMLAATEFTFRR